MPERNMADQVITKQELIDAQKDAQTLEDVINGPSGELIETRLGRQVYTLASVPQINTMTREEVVAAVTPKANQTYVDEQLSTKAPQSNTYTKAEVDTTFAAYVGGRKAYTTLALAQAAQPSLPANTAIEVTNDGANNGTYQWNGTTLTKSAYDPLTQAKADATIKANAAELNANNYSKEKIKEALDSFHNVSSNRKDLFQINDDNFNVLLSIDEKGNLVVPQSKQPVQNAMGVYPGLKAKTRLPQESLQSVSIELMSYLPFSGISYAPCPLGLQPQRYSVNPVDLGNLKIGTTTQVEIDTRYALNDSVVHPSIVEFYGGFRGYRYLMAITPYLSATVENPIIYGSNDLVNFEILDGFEQPLALAKSDGIATSIYLSDPNLSYDPINGLLVCTYRNNGTYQGQNHQSTGIFARTTRNGYEWSEEITLSEMTPYEDGDKKLSPSLVYNPTTKKWMMWVNTGVNGVRLQVSDSLDGVWETVHTKRYADRGMWHLEVRFVGGMFVMITANSEATTNFEILTSSDGENWTYRGNLFAENQSNLYKPSFLVNLNADKTLSMTIVWTDSAARKMIIGETNTINYGEA